MHSLSNCPHYDLYPQLTWVCIFQAKLMKLLLFSWSEHFLIEDQRMVNLICLREIIKCWSCKNHVGARKSNWKENIHIHQTPKGKSKDILRRGGFKQCTRYEAIKLQFLEELQTGGRRRKNFQGFFSWEGYGYFWNHAIQTLDPLFVCFFHLTVFNELNYTILYIMLSQRWKRIWCNKLIWTELAKSVCCYMCTKLVDIHCNLIIRWWISTIRPTVFNQRMRNFIFCRVLRE